MIEETPMPDWDRGKIVPICIFTRMSKPTCIEQAW